MLRFQYFVLFLTNLLLASSRIPERDLALLLVKSKFESGRLVDVAASKKILAHIVYNKDLGNREE